MKTSFLRRLSAGLLALGLSVACVPGALAQSVEIDGATTTLGNTGPGAARNAGVPIFNPVKDHAAPIDGVTDATTAIVASLADCSAAGGGAVWLPAYSYVLNSADVTIPTGCWIKSDWAPVVGVWPFTSKPALLLSSAYSIVQSPASGIENVAVFRYGMTQPTDVRSTVNGIAAFAGTAIKPSNDAWITNVFVVGFNWCFNPNGAHVARLRVDHFYGDCTNGGLWDQAHDVTKANDVHFYPFFSPLAFDLTTYNVSGAADNGSGAIRLTIPANILVSGDTVEAALIGGFTGADNRWTAVVVDSTHIDLCRVYSAGSCATYSQSAPSTTGTWSSGSNAITVASTNSLAIGQTVSGTNIAGGSTLSAVDWQQKIIYLSASTTGAGSGTALTFGNAAFTSGGTVNLNTAIRTGAAFQVSNSEGLQFSNTFAFGYDKAYYMTTGLIWANFTNASCDSFNATRDPVSQCLVIDSNASGLTWIGGVMSSAGTAININTSSSVSNIISGVVGAVNTAGGNLVSMAAGVASISMDGSAIDIISVADGVGALSVCGSLPGTTIQLNTSTGAGKIGVCPATVLVSGSQRGTRGSMDSLSVGGSNTRYATGLTVTGYLASDHSQGGQITLINPSAGGLLKYLRVNTANQLDVLNAAYAVLLSLTDAGSFVVRLGDVNVLAGGYQVNSVAGVTCTVGTLNTATATIAKGIITHC